jgi:hypothetical protein
LSKKQKNIKGLKKICPKLNDKESPRKNLKISQRSRKNQKKLEKLEKTLKYPKIPQNTLKKA